MNSVESEKMTTLPVDAIRPDFVAALTQDTQPLIVTAPTGSGKSTRLPGWIAEALDAPVLVIEPRRVACRSLATFLAQQAGEEVGASIGYSIRFEDVRGAKTQVLFVTPGVALRMLSSEDFPFGAVLIDEFHERGWEVDLASTLLLLRRKEAPELRLVMTSATLEAEALARSLGARVLEASGRTYPVEISYQARAKMPTREELDQRVERAVVAALDDPESEDGEVLVFLPGKGEIASCQRSLSSRFKGRGDVEIVPVHASLPMNKLMRAFASPRPGRRRVFLATNVAETSVTLPGVTWVIDAGLVRMQIHRGGRMALALVACSKAAMDQRAGRAGRVRPGKCVRLWERNWAPKPSTPPEIERTELDDLVLRAASCGLTDLPRAPWVTPPPEFALSSALDRLRSIGAIDAKGALTKKGARLSQMPVSAHDARALIDPPEELAAVVADVIAVVERGRRLALPVDKLRADQRGQVVRARQDLLEGITNDVYEALCWLRHGDAKRHGLNASALAEARKIATDFRKLVGAPRLRPSKQREDLPDPEVLAGYLLERMPEAAFVLRKRAQKAARKPRKFKSSPWANGLIEVMYGGYTPANEHDRVDEEERPVAGVMLDHTWLSDTRGYGVSGRGSLLLPCSLGVLAKSVPGELSVGQLQVKKNRGRIKIKASVEKRLAGVLLSTTHDELTGDALREAVVELVLDNRIFKGAGEQLRDRLFLSGVLKQWTPVDETAHWDARRLGALDGGEPEEFLRARLRELELEECDELELLEADDLLPDLPRLTGIAAYELEEFAVDFPRVWEHLGARYSCKVSVAARRVTMEPLNQAAKKGKDPGRDVIPRFRGFRVMYRKASRVVALRG